MQLTAVKFPNPNTARIVVETPRRVALMVTPFPMRLHQSGRANSKLTLQDKAAGQEEFVDDISKVRGMSPKPPAEVMSPKGYVKTDTKMSLALEFEVTITDPTIFFPSVETIEDCISSKKATTYVP